MTWIVSLVSFSIGFIVGVVTVALVLALTGEFERLPWVGGRFKND